MYMLKPLRSIWEPLLPRTWGGGLPPPAPPAALLMRFTSTVTKDSKHIAIIINFVVTIIIKNIITIATLLGQLSV